MSKSGRLIKSLILLVAALFVMAFGVAFSIKADLGTSPISSVPYVISLCSQMTVGNITIIMNMLFVGIQVILLRKKFKLKSLVQVPVVFAFGYILDFANWVLTPITHEAYWQQAILCGIGICLVGIGVFMAVESRLGTMSGDGLCLAICQLRPIKFGNIKIVFDSSLVVTSVIISLVFLHGVYGVREGTVAAALLVGTVVKLCGRIMKHIRNPHKAKA